MADEKQTVNDRIGNPFGTPKPEETPIGRRKGMWDKVADFFGTEAKSKAAPAPSPTSDTIDDRIGNPWKK